MVEKRSVATAIILSIITCGIYGIYWYIKLNDEINTVNGDLNDTSGGMVFLFSIITCGIYMFYWMYKMGDKLDQISVKKGMPTQSRGILYIVLTIFGLSIVSYALMQDSLNKFIDNPQ